MAGKGFTNEGFSQVSTKEGDFSVELFGDKQDIHYKSECFVNSDGTIGYARMSVKDQEKIMFISKTQTCSVYTILADRDDELPMNVEGVRVWGVSGGEIDKYYEQHLRALKGDEPVADPNWLKEELEKGPQTVLDISMKMLGQIFDSMGGPDGLMQKMADAFTAPDGPMAQMAEGLNEAFKDLGTVGTVEEEKPAEVVTTPKPKKKANAPMRKAPPKKKPKAPVKKATPKKAKRPAPRKGKKKR